MADEMLLSYLVVGAVLDFPVPATLQRFARDVDVLAIDAAPGWRDKSHNVLDQLQFARVQTVEGLVGDGSQQTYHRAVYHLSSSTRPSAESFRDWSSCRPDMRLSWRTNNTSIRTLPMESRPLSQLVSDHGLASVDFIYTDIEGADLEALSSLGDALEQQVVGIDSEAQLEPMFEGQPLFADMHAVLREAGFLVRDLSFGRWAPFRSYSGLGGAGFPVTGHVTFAKHPNRLASMQDPVLASLKSALLAIAEVDLDYAAIVLSAAVRNPEYGERARDLMFNPQREWMGFLGDFARAIQADLGVMLPDVLEGHRGKNELGEQLDVLRRHATDRPTPVEELLRKFGLEQLADTAADQRMENVGKTLKMLSRV